MTIKSLSSPQIALVMKKGRAYSSGSFLLKTLCETTVFDNKRQSSAENAERGHIIQITTSKDGPPTFFCSFIAPKKIFAKAVDRNKAKRRLKESFFEAIRNIKERDLKISNLQFVFLAKKEIMKDDFTNIIQDIKQILLKDYIIR